jgi:hypothetical protein
MAMCTRARLAGDPDASKGVEWGTKGGRRVWIP